jgi:hypothetical protein
VTEFDTQLAHDTMRGLLDGIHALREALTPPAAPDDEVRAWRLYSGWEYGGVYCAQVDCGCAAEGSEILRGDDAAHEADEDAPTFTLNDLHKAVAEHIEHRAAIKAEEAEVQR